MLKLHLNINLADNNVDNVKNIDFSNLLNNKTTILNKSISKKLIIKFM
jgi:hypothetical protein